MRCGPVGRRSTGSSYGTASRQTLRRARQSIAFDRHRRRARPPPDGRPHATDEPGPHRAPTPGRDRARPSRTCARAGSSRFRPRRSTALAPTPATRTRCARIFAAKGRPADHPVIVHLADADATWRTGRATCPAARGARRRVLARAADADPAARAARPRTSSPAGRTASACACRRIRSRARCCAFAAARRRHRRAVGQPLRPRLADDRAHVADDLGDGLALILDGGACDVGIESTIVAFARRRSDAAAPGRHRRPTTRARAGRRRSRRRDDAPRASGTLASHYAPRTPAAARAADALRASSPARRRATKPSRCSRARCARRRISTARGSPRRGMPRLRARSVREPARARRRRRRRHPDRGRAGRRRMARGARPPRARDARRGRRSRLTLARNGGTGGVPMARKGRRAATMTRCGDQANTFAMPASRPPIIVVAPDSFKGSLDAPGVCAAIARGLRRVWPDAEVRACPMADGGEGTLDAVLAAVGPAGRRLHERVRRRAATACRRLRDRRCARRHDRDHRGRADRRHHRPRRHGGRRGRALDPRRRASSSSRCSTRGVRRFMIGLGGSSTNDGGAGLLAALGLRSQDGGRAPSRRRRAGSARSRASTRGGSTRGSRLRDHDHVGRQQPAVRRRAARRRSSGRRRAFAPARSPRIDATLARFAALAERAVGRSAAERPGAGAAGGLGFALQLVGGSFRSGAEVVADLIGLDAALDGRRLGDHRRRPQRRADAARARRPSSSPSARVRRACRSRCCRARSTPAALPELAPVFDGCFALPAGPMALADCIAHRRRAARRPRQ